MAGSSKEWFGEWFNSPFYHILYKHRDFEEAKSFIDQLSGLLVFKNNQKVLDAGCGRGRHAVFLNETGLDVTGIDLSEESISFASKFENDHLKFYVHDIREEFRKEEFDIIFNLFTSFGFFEKEEDNYKTIAAFAQGLKKGGKLVIDFMNTDRILKQLVSEQESEVEGIKFFLTRKVENNFIVKTIRFTVERIDYEFYEKVRIIYKEDFLKYFNFAGLSLNGLFGNYKLEKFEKEKSERMIFIVTKN
jgi:SAM-dependent methyltransferase